jgi:putative Holliday junction resolvase
MRPVIVLGVDLGDRRIGLAVSDPDETLAVGAGTLFVRSEREALAAIGEVVRERGIERAVVGLPLSMGGGRGPRAQKTERFVERLRAALSVPVSVWDERLTTVEAERALREISPPGRARPGRADEAAAVLLLQNWLDARRARGSEG